MNKFKIMKRLAFTFSLLTMLNVASPLTNMKLLNTKAYANSMKFGVAPSIFYNTRIPKGTTTNLSIFLANNSELFDSKAETIKDYTIDVAMSIKCDMTKEEKNKYVDIIQKGFRIQPSIRTLKPNQKDKVQISLTVPNDVEIGEYRYSLLFTKLSSKKEKDALAKTGNSEVLTSIEVPLYLEIYDPQHPNKGVVRQGSIVNTSLRCGSDDNLLNTSKNQFSDDIKNILTDVVRLTFLGGSPSAFKHIIHDITYKPYKLSTKNKTYIDVKQEQIKPLTKSLAYDINKLDLDTYVLAKNKTSDMNDIAISDVVFSDSIMLISLSNGRSVEYTTKYKGIMSKLKKQYEELKNQNNNRMSLTLGQLETLLTVPKSPVWSNGVVLHNKLRNTGNITSKPVCNVKVTDENNAEIDFQKVPTKFLTPKEDCDLAVNFDKLSTANSNKFKFDTAVAMGSDPSNADKVNVMCSELTVFSAPIRVIIVILSVLLGLSVLLCLTKLITYFIKRLRYRDNKSQNLE